MKVPIIVNENGDLSIYESVAEAALWMEAIDVINDEYCSGFAAHESN